MAFSAVVRDACYIPSSVTPVKRVDKFRDLGPANASGPFRFQSISFMSDEEHGQPYLSSSRALGAYAREFARLSDGIIEGATAAFGDVEGCTVTVRRSPERCILQVGPAALTVAFVRSHRDSPEGELLVMHWRGNVAPTLRQRPERAGQPTRSAEALSETIFVPEATSETDWMWRSCEEPVSRYTSLSLAALVIERLRIVHDEASQRLTA